MGYFIEVNSGGGGWKRMSIDGDGFEISDVAPTTSQVYLNGTALYKIKKDAENKIKLLTH